MEFINWGSETQEQLLIRRRLEEAAQLEAYAKWVNRIKATSGAVGGGGVADDTINSYVENGYVSNYFV
jgi:hypothetical protein